MSRPAILPELKKILIAGGLVVVLGGLGLFLWARSVLTGDGVRVAVAGQLSKALGQPVAIGSVGVTILPRVTMTLRDVTIGEPARITAKELYVGTDFHALLSRRIEHAVLRLAGARVVLPLPPLGGADASGPEGGSPPGKPPVDLVSVDAISLSDVEVVSGRRTLHGDVDLRPNGSTVEIRKAAFGAEGTALTLTGQITNLDGPVADLALNAQGLNFDELLAFVTDFAASAGTGTGSGRPAASERARAPRASATAAVPMSLWVSISADRATVGTLALDKLSGRAHITADGLRLDPVKFGVFGGTTEGALAFTLADTPAFRLKASLAGIDMTPLMAFTGQPGAITGRLTGSVDVTGRGLSAKAVTDSTRGTARVEIVNGTIKGLGLVRTLVLATSGRSDSKAGLGQSSPAEPFSHLSATLVIAEGSAGTQDLRFESKDVLVSAAAAMHLDGSAVAVTGPVQLSDELTQQAGRDLVRYTQKDGRVTLPVSITGSLDHLQVHVDVADLSKRAITNAADELLKALQKKIGRGGGGGGQ